MLNKKAKNSKFLKRTISITLAMAIALGSGTMLTSLVKSPANTTSACIVSKYDNQTQNLVDINNIIKPNFYLNAKMNFGSNKSNEGLPQSVDISLSTPAEYKTEDLILRVFPKASLPSVTHNDYRIDSVTQKLHLSVSDSAQKGTVKPLIVYEVDVYNKQVTEKNFIGKSEFLVVADFDMWQNKNKFEEYQVVDGVGNPVYFNGTNLKALFPASKSTQWINEKILCALPVSAFPFDADSIKVVAFAGKPENRVYKTINISAYSYAFYHNERLSHEPKQMNCSNDSSSISSGSWLVFGPDTIDKYDPQVEYEFHFYKNNVVEGNFIFKVTGVKLPIKGKAEPV